MSELVAVEQRQVSGDAAAWVREHGHMVLGRDNNRRLRALHDGLERHPRVRTHVAEVDDDVVEGVLSATHDQDYLTALRAVHTESPVVLADRVAPGSTPDVPVSAGLVAAAYEGVRTAVAAGSLLIGGARFTYALCRPPGHHAGPGWCGGYCYLNNAAATARLLCQGGVASVAIIDIDLHYGNGTAAIVAPMPAVSLYSLHASSPAIADAAPLSARERVIRFERPPSVAAYLDAFRGAVEACEQTAAALVLSLGYDTIAGDPHGSWRFPPAIFAYIGRLLASTGLPVCVVQEGGYSLRALPACSNAFAVGLLGDD
jgi:acetoin utilization deacetylase AcuC-like enzyme